MALPQSHRIGRLIDAHDSERKFVQVDIYRGYPPAELEGLEAQWATAREEAAEKGLAVGLASIEHAHWDWRNKIHSVEAGRQMLVAIEHRHEVQGIMAVLQTPQRSWISGEPLI